MWWLCKSLDKDCQRSFGSISTNNGSSSVLHLQIDQYLRPDDLTSGPIRILPDPSYDSVFADEDGGRLQ